ncbi:hypothetical protein Gasu2_57810 [Galdieria sulphuraria]|nr:hypothetical protein Gasu2_57810 [Galdieria sulphuraria]
MGGGAWPFLVGGVICLVNSVNERDLFLLTSYIVCEDIRYILLRGTIRFFSRMEVLGNNSCKRPFLRRVWQTLKLHRAWD